jgi:uncharacterized protein
MSFGPYAAIEFVHPDFGRSAGDTAIQLPDSGMQLAPNGHVAVVDGEDAVRQSILLLLTTRPGERVMRPEYGCNLQLLLFSPNDDTTAGLAIHYVRQALERWEPRIRLIRLDAVAHRERAEVIEIHLEYRVLISNRVERLVVPVSLSGREA